MFYQFSNCAKQCKLPYFSNTSDFTAEELQKELDKGTILFAINPDKRPIRLGKTEDNQLVSADGRERFMLDGWSHALHSSGDNPSFMLPVH